jgi:hypothetical protein
LKFGIIPSKSSWIHDEEDNQCSSLSEQQQALQNMWSNFDMTELKLMTVSPRTQREAYHGRACEEVENWQCRRQFLM